MFELQNVESLWLWLLGVVAGAGLLYVTYLGIFRRSERRLTWVLFSLRALGILALLMALARPVWTEDNTLVDPGRLAVVLDTSRSMTLADPGGKSRYELAREAVKQLKDEIETGEGEKVQVELFDITGEPFTDGIPDEPQAGTTDLVRAANRVESRLRSRLLIGTVLVTDGMDNSGREDILQLADSVTPIHAIGFRDDPNTAELDLSLREPRAPEQVLVNNKVTVQVPVVRAAGDPGLEVSATVTVRLADKAQATQRVTLSAGENQVEASLTFEPIVAGRFVYRVDVATAAGERVQANNSKQFALQVNAEAIGVMYLEGFLRYEYRFLRKRLDDDPDISLVTLVRSANPDRPDPEGAAVLVTPTRLENVHLVILGDMEADFLSAAEYQALKDWVNEEGHAILVLGGYRSFGPNGFGTTPLADTLPVVFSGPGDQEQSDESFTMDLTVQGQAHPIFQISGDRVSDLAMWRQAAQLAGCSLVQRAKPGAVVLANNPVVQVGEQPAVVMATQNYGAGKTMVVTADTTWKWSRVARLKGQSDALYARFWSQTVRWLTGRDLDDQQAPLVVSTDRPGYADGEPVQVRVVQRGDELAETTLSARIVNPAGKERPVPLRVAADGSGDRVATLFPDSSGRHVIHAEVTRGGQIVANQDVALLVHGEDLETADTRTNSQLLRQITSERGVGVYVDVDQVETLAQRLATDRKHRTVKRSSEPREYWNSPFLFAFFLAAVTGEWWIRRRNRLV